MEKYDVIIIGGGPGGYPCAIRCGQNGLKTAIIEKEALGGVCLNKGCIPTKSLFEIATELEPSFTDGITKQTEFDWKKTVEWIRSKVIMRLRTGIGFLLKQNGVDLYTGKGMVKDPVTVEVNGKILTADKIVLATGSSAAVPDAFAGDRRIITSDTIWELEKLPESIAVVGGGFIGCEFASILKRFGVKVSIYEMFPHLLPGKDTEIVQMLEKIFKQDGIGLTFGQKISSLDSLNAEKVLWSTGRTPNSDDFGSLGLEMENRAVKTDGKLESSVAGIHAIGDLNGKYPLAYVATKEGEVAADVIAGKEVSMSYDNIPDAIFAFPGLAFCGLTEDAAKERGYRIKVGKCPYQAIGKAYATGKLQGMVKIVSEEPTGKVLGIHLIGEASSEIVSMATLAISKGMTVSQIADTWFCHPTFSEAILEAALAMEGRPVHLLPAKK